MGLKKKKASSLGETVHFEGYSIIKLQIRC